MYKRSFILIPVWFNCYKYGRQQFHMSNVFICNLKHSYRFLGFFIVQKEEKKEDLRTF